MGAHSYRQVQKFPGEMKEWRHTHSSRYSYFFVSEKVETEGEGET